MSRATADCLNVSRETFLHLGTYVALVEKWNPHINLVARSTLSDLWDRHITDSVQIWQYAPQNWRKWADFGSGGGFPGLVMAILAKEHNPDGQVILVESDQRKAVFLRTVIRQIGLNAKVLDDRIEQVPALQADVISARALADLNTLLGFFVRHGAENSTGLFPKGAKWAAEVANAQENWCFSFTAHGSITQAEAVVLAVEGVSRV